MTRREPRIVTKQRSRPRPVPSPDDPMRDAVVIGFCIGLLALIYLFADMVSVTQQVAR